MFSSENTEHFYKCKRTLVTSGSESVTRPCTDRLSLNVANYSVKCFLNMLAKFFEHTLTQQIKPEV